MILGIGIDILEINRIKKIFIEKPDRLKQHILSKTEIEEFNLLKNDNNKISFLSKRFVAKEAFGKAIGCGVNNKYLSLSDITISHDKLGRPFVVKNVKITEAIRKFHHLSNYEILISSADEKHFATANVILQDVQNTIIGFLKTNK